MDNVTRRTLNTPSGTPGGTCSTYTAGVRGTSTACDLGQAMGCSSTVEYRAQAYIGIPQGGRGIYAIAGRCSG